MDAKEIIRRADRAQARFDQWRGIMQDVYKYFLPGRDAWHLSHGSSSRGEDRNNRTFDSTAIHALARLANRLHSAMFPSGQQWCSFEPGEAVPAEDKADLTEALYTYQKAFFDALNDTNFDTAMSELLHDFGIGTGVLSIMDGGIAAPVVFKAVSPSMVVFENEPDGAPRNLYRQMKVRVGSIKRIWGDDVKLSHRLEQLIQKEPDADEAMLEATIEDDDGINHYVLVKEDKAIIQTRKLTHNPWLVARYSVLADEELGRGPAFNALPHARVINLAMQYHLKQGAMDINPPVQYNPQVLYDPGGPVLEPGIGIPVMAMGGPMGEAIKPINFGSRYDITQLTLDDMRMQINKMMGDSAVPPDNRKPRTASEIHERIRELATTNASMFARANAEIMRPLVVKIAHILTKRGLLPDIAVSDHKQIRIVPVSPIAQQDKSEEARNISMLMELQGATGSQVVNNDRAIRRMAGILNTPPEILYTEEEVAEMEAGKAAFIQQQMAMQAAQQGAPPTETESGPDV